MSEFHVQIVRLGPMRSHPNADTLNITSIFDYQIITKKDGFKEGDLVVYIPVDSVVPDTEDWYFLCPLNSEGKPRYPLGEVPEKYRVIEAKKLRGIFSQGVLAPLPAARRPTFDVIDNYDDAPDGAIHNELGIGRYQRCNDVWLPLPLREGDDVRLMMNIVKYEPLLPAMTGGECEAAPKGWQFVTYTDIEGIRRYPDVLQEGEEVIITEKIHGCNYRAVHDGERVWVGSHTQIKKENSENIWWQPTALLNELRLAIEDDRYPFHIFFGELYGQVQDLKYGVKSGVQFRCFDVFDAKKMCYLDHDDAITITGELGIPWVPVLYRGFWKPELSNLCEGKSMLADNIREGFVVKPVKERYDDRIGRVILKRHGESFLLRKRKL